jgi:hypothetical protein
MTRSASLSWQRALSQPIAWSVRKIAEGEMRSGKLLLIDKIERRATRRKNRMEAAAI